MSDDAPTAAPPPAGDGSSGWETLLDRFDRACQAGGGPRLEDFLNGEAAALPLPALMALVHVDLEYRLKAGEGARIEEYLARFPEIAGDDSRLLDLVAWECLLRRRREPEVSVEEYARRFPRLG